MLDIYNYLL